MVELSEKNIRGQEIQSSKGNQLKWQRDGIWYKADYTGYEGLAEYMVSSLLKASNLESSEYISYQTEEILYKKRIRRGCKSKDFLPEKWQLITLERLFSNFFGKSLYQSIYQIEGAEQRAEFLVEQVKRMTGLTEFGVYLCKLLTIDALFLNEDRHTHNIAVLLDPDGKYHYCPIFDNGAALLSDIVQDYAEEEPVLDLIPQVQAKTLSRDFDEQLDVVEQLYGQPMHFSFNEKEVEELLEQEEFYPEKQKRRIQEILFHQKRKYEYLFDK